jgi:VWFA-related protein
VRRRFLSVLCAGGLLATAVSADQGSLPAFIEHVEVQQVNLEVFATSADGRPVGDLGAADFTVYEDGKPVAVQSFSRVDGSAREAAPARSAEAAEAASPTYLVIFLDELHMGAAQRGKLFEELAETLSHRMPAATRVMIARYENGTQTLLPFTADLAKARQTLEAAALTPSPRQLLGDQDRTYALDAIQSDAETGPCLYGDELARTYSGRKQDEVLSTLAALDRLVGTLDGLPGRKAVLYVSNGVPLRPGEEAWDTYLELCGGGGASRGAVGAIDTSTFGQAQGHRPNPQKLRLEALTFDTSARWEALAARANGQGVSLYSLVPGGPAAQTGPIDSNLHGPSVITLAGNAANQADAIFFLSAETGGKVLYNGAALEESLAAMAGDLGRYYLLGYPAPDPESPRIHQLRVEVNRPGVTLRHRRSYALKSREQQATDRLLTRLYHGVGDNPLGLGLALAAAPAPAAEPASARESHPGETVRLRVPLRKLTLLNENGTARGAIMVYLVSRDEAGRVTPVRRRAIPLSVPAAEGAAAPDRDFVYEVAIPLSKGRNDVAVAVRDELSGEIAFLRETFTVKKAVQ